MMRSPRLAALIVASITTTVAACSAPDDLLPPDEAYTPPPRTHWALVEPAPVRVSTFASDTGPFPDRTEEIPVLMQIAESLRFPKDLRNDSNWFPAAEVFG